MTILPEDRTDLKTIPAGFWSCVKGAPALRDQTKKSFEAALPDEILMQVEKPARYIGGELNSVRKDENRVLLRFAVCFPDVYEIGMSHLGIQILYDQFNSWEDVLCERVYSPWPDLHRILKEKSIPLFTLESQKPVKGFDFLGITLQYELSYTNVLQILDLSGIPFDAKERGPEDPIVIGGGPCAYNPEPLAEFFDLFYIGEGETRYRELFDLYIRAKQEGISREEFLFRASQLPGIYAPRFYAPTYNADGTLQSFLPTREGVPERIRKELVRDLSKAHYIEHPIVPFLQVTQDRVVLEIQRGCIRGCRFCQAGQLYRPVREKSLETLKEQAIRLMDASGQEEISLSSLSSSDYSKLPELTDFLLAECGKRKVNISLPSLRVDAFSLDIMEKVQDIKKSSLTFAPEAGSQRLRDVINKNLTKEDILRGVEEAFRGGWTKVKLYFMLGLPTETEEDIRGIAELCNEIAACYFDTVPKEERKSGRVQITASTSFFIPKPFTPFQWASMNTGEEFLHKAALTKESIRSVLNQKSIRYNWHEAYGSFIEGFLARGDRKAGKVLRYVYEHGGFFDAWSEYFQKELWEEAFRECQVEPAFFTTRKREEDELFPWDFIDCGVDRAFLLREWKRATQEGRTTPNCKEACQGCGAMQFRCGICPA